jgi:hypothetical protein
MAKGNSGPELYTSTDESLENHDKKNEETRKETGFKGDP